MSEEQWKPWPKNTWYSVSSLGRVKSGTGTVLAQRWRKTNAWQKGPGYLVVGISRRDRPDGTRNGGDQAIHVMVCEAFYGPRPPGYQAAHIDGEPSNNAVGNLVWATRRENRRDHVIAQGRATNLLPYKLTEEQIQQIGVLYANKKITIRSIALHFGVTHAAVQHHVKKQGWCKRRRSPTKKVKQKD